jgi:hypothetical protein
MAVSPNSRCRGVFDAPADLTHGGMGAVLVATVGKIKLRAFSVRVTTV